MLEIPEMIADACAPLFEAVPLDRAMSYLTGSHPHHRELVEQVLSNPVLKERPELATALWLYVDDLDRSHTISQSINTPAGSYWHGIMHRREGDFSNSHHWMRMAASHPLRQSRPDLDPDTLIDDVARARGSEDASLIDRQRAEWKALFEWCAAEK